MESTIANILLILLIIIYFASLPQVFAKAGREKWEGLVPGYNIYIWLKIMKKPWWWLILMIIPGVNFLMIFIMNVELGRSFGMRSFTDGLKFTVLPWIYIPLVAYDKNMNWVGPMEFRETKKTFAREWFDAILFAVIAATIIRTFFLEAFKIPTPSMEKNLLVGDFLFVSKVSYGAKLPETPISFPFTHNTLPWGEGRSYLEIFKMPHMRLPGFGSIQRNDVVVFNFPAGDSVCLDYPEMSYYHLMANIAFSNYLNGRTLDASRDTLELRLFNEVKERYIGQVRKAFMKKDRIIFRPVDKRDNYIKRCVGIPGDIIEVRDRQLYVNGEPSGNTELMQFNYLVRTNQPIRPGKKGDGAEYLAGLKEAYDISASDVNIRMPEIGLMELPLTKENHDKFVQMYGEENVIAESKPRGWYLNTFELLKKAGPNEFIRHPQFLPVFPNDINYDWTEDNFGPLKIPSKGETVELNIQNLPLYKRIIDVYEGNDLEVKNGEIFINGAKATSYTFKMNYYWLMGDNRQNSLDSRFWGFVPDDHVVGKAVLIWFSSDPATGIRWNRMLKGIK